MTNQQKNNLFKRARKFIRAAKGEMALHVHEEVETIRNKQKLDAAPAPIVVSDCKTIERLIVPTNNGTRLTYAPSSGRVTLKLTGRESDEDNRAITRVCNNLMKTATTRNIIMSIRGAVKRMPNGIMAVHMSSNNKLQSIYVTEEV